MDLPRCPHCYAPIQVQPDGTCPACRKNTLQAPAENRRYSVVEISANQELPACCVLCGKDTSLLENFEFRYDSHWGNNLDDQAFLAFVLLGLFTAGLALCFLPAYRKYIRRRNQMVYHIALPMCDTCRPKKPLYHPVTIEGTVYHLRVHKGFKNRLLALAPPKPTLARN